MTFGINLLSQTDRQGMRRNRRSEPLPTPADELLNVYNIFIEVMENPTKASYLALMSKIKPDGKNLIDFYLFDKKDTIDWKIKKLTEYILRIIKFQ